MGTGGGDGEGFEGVGEPGGGRNSLEAGFKGLSLFKGEESEVHKRYWRLANGWIEDRDRCGSDQNKTKSESENHCL